MERKDMLAHPGFVIKKRKGGRGEKLKEKGHPELWRTSFQKQKDV